MTDTERLDWLEQITHKGYCPTILFNDDGLWAVTFSGWINMADKSHHAQVTVPWSETIREAIDYARKRVGLEEK